MSNDKTTKSGKLLGRFAQSHNNVQVEITEERAILAGIAYQLTWIEDHAFYYLFTDGYWYYIRRGDTYEAIKYTDNTSHQLRPIK